MTKNIIFDLGNVLIKYDPFSFIKQNIKVENQENFYNIVFKGEEWEALDRGTITSNEAIIRLSKKIPQEEKNINKLFSNSIQDVLFLDKTNLEYVKSLKSKDYKLYILSNFHKDGFNYVENMYKLSRIFDEKVISYDCHLLKPEAAIYSLILSKYNLKPEETIFIDDSQNNIIASQKMGIQGIHLKNMKELIKTLNNTLNI